MGGARIGVDIGGTFTDLVVLAEDRLSTVKVPSTPREPSVGVLDAIDASGIDSETVAFFAHGTTVGTNALLERTGAKTALVTTDGFRDVIEIGRQNRPSLYDLTLNRPAPLVPRDLRFTVRERMGPSGPIKPLEHGNVDQVLRALNSVGVQAVAVCLLFGFLHPEHERRVGEEIREALPDLHVSLSSEVLPEFREFERQSTTVANAYLAPVLAGYLKDLAAQSRQRGLPPPLVMQSSGGVLDAQSASARAAACVLSGPAGGVIGATHVSGLSGFRDVLTLDMGGTSTDVAPIVDGRPQTTTEMLVAGVPIKFPMIDVHTVSAGGGSIGWIDRGGALRVGPRSSGAEPGPASYGKGGPDPTVTDANLVLGYLADQARLGGEVVLERSLAEKAVLRIAGDLDIGIVEAALGLHEVANAEMARALRVVSVQRGMDPREFAMVAFGGAGPMHACALAEELGIETILVPRSGGVLSALGLAMAELRRDYVSPIIGSLDELDPGGLATTFARMQSEAQADLPSPVLRAQADLRYRGQSFELTVDANGDADELREAFHLAHERRHGYRMQDEPVEMVNARVVATVPGALPELSEAPSGVESEVDTRTAWFEGGRQPVPIHDRRRMGAGSTLEGPAIVEFPESTCVLRPGWRGEVDEVGSLVLRRS